MFKQLIARDGASEDEGSLESNDTQEGGPLALQRSLSLRSSGSARARKSDSDREELAELTEERFEVVREAFMQVSSKCLEIIVRYCRFIPAHNI